MDELAKISSNAQLLDNTENIVLCSRVEPVTGSGYGASLFNVLDTSLWPARWNCGTWSEEHGWLYILSDLSIWLAYFAIPVLLGVYYFKKGDNLSFNKTYLLFIAFILCCGLTHLLDAIIFWWPAYKLSAWLRLGTALVSWATVFSLVKVAPKAFSLKTPEDLERIIDEKTIELKDVNEKLSKELRTREGYEAKIQELNKRLETQVAERTEQLKVANSTIDRVMEFSSEIQREAQIGFWEYDIGENKLYWSDIVYDIHELPSGTVVDVEKGIDFYHPDYKEVISHAFERCMTEGSKFDLELKIITAKGKEKWVTSIGGSKYDGDRIVGVRGLFHDISERKELELAQQATEDTFRLFIKHAPTAIAMLDNDMNYLMASDRWYDQFTIEEEDIIGLNHYDVFPEVQKKESWLAEHREVLAGVVVTNESDHLEMDDGRKIFLRYAMYPWYKSDNEIGGIGIFSEDITYQKSRELDLQNEVINQTRELQNVNEELKAFSYSVSHDLRSPLRSIHGFSQALEEDYADKLDDEGRDYLKRIKSASDRMSELIDDLLMLSRITQSEMKAGSIDVTSLAHDVINMMDLPDHYDISVQQGIECVGDRKMIKILLENLVGNAVKYSSKTQAPEIFIGEVIREGEKHIMIKDNGAGFDMAYVDKLFGAFQRLHRRDEFEGSGIGLATAKRIVNLHKGEITVEAEVGKGATFYFTLKPKL